MINTLKRAQNTRGIIIAFLALIVLLTVAYMAEEDKVRELIRR